MCGSNSFFEKKCKMLSYFQLSNVFIYGKLTGLCRYRVSTWFLPSDPVFLQHQKPVLAICTIYLFCPSYKNTHLYWICTFIRFSLLKMAYWEYLRKVLCTFFEIYSTNLSSANRLTICRIVVNFLRYFFPLRFIKE